MNAYDPSDRHAAISKVPGDADLWALRNKPDLLTFLASEDAPDLRDWSHPKVGWGLIVPENPQCSGKESPELADYDGDPIRDLWKARGSGPVFRYDRNRKDNLVLIRNARDNEDVLLRAGPVGLGPGCLPRYLLIYGSPKEIPWDLQYVLNQNSNCFPGRIPFRGDEAKNYVRALSTNFSAATAKRSAALVWSAVWPEEQDRGISNLMHDVIAAPVFQRFKSDSELSGALFLDRADATVDRLATELKQRQPAMLVSTSHGQTGPTDRPDDMARALGLPLDSASASLNPADLLKNWSPGGAICYVHACCSAGSDEHTNFENLFVQGSTADLLVHAIAALGSQVAPLPLALLRAENPVRAFVGHVEPTLDFSLTQPETGLPTTAALLNSLYDHLYRAKPETIGMAFRESFDRIGEMIGLFQDSYREYNRGRDEEMTPQMIWSLLAANDLKTTVILGDPVVTLPAPQS